MKKMILISSILMATATSSVYAESDYSAVRKAGVFFSSAIAGAALGGPVGMVAAAAGGTWLDEQVEKAGQVDDIEMDLVEANQQIEALQYRLAVAEEASEHYAQVALDQLQLEMLFKTGQSELTVSGKKRIAMLADFMNNHQELEIRLDGYADPRGDANYNLSLSNDRVKSVVEQLVSSGIDDSRVSTYSHGASESQSSKGDLDSYALERVVRIQLSKGNKMDAVANVTLSQ